MLTCLAFHPRDASAALDLLAWVRDLGGLKAHSCLLIADAACDWGICLDAIRLAEEAFGSAEILTTPEPINAWLAGANLFFMTAAAYAQARDIPFLWLEPDAIPLRAGWLDEISKAYALCPPESFMGHVYDWDGRRVLSGIAVYPAQALSFIGPLLTDKVAFDVAARDQVAQRAVDTPLIRHQWGWKDLAPTFVEFRAGHSGLADDNVIGLNQLPPGCVLYHRNKDGTALRLLRAKLFPPKPLPIAVVFPYCSHDAALMLHHLRWMAHLHPKKNATAVVHHDGSAAPAMQNDIYQATSAVFSRVYASRYVCKTTGWPHACNTAFAAAARYMDSLKMPWLFSEPDALPIKPDWLEQICAEYERCGKPFMGAYIRDITPPAGHVNGVAVYPSHAARVLHHGMSASNLAFDTEMAKDMITQLHHANHLIQHCREQPEFKSKEDIQKWIPDTVVLYHPDKHGTLCRLLVS